MYYENRVTEISVRPRPGGQIRLISSPHLHYHLELVYIYEGSSGVNLDSQEYNIPEDSVFLALSNQTHAYIPNEKTSHLTMIVSPDVLPELSTILESKQPKTPVLENVSSYPELHALLWQIIEESNRKEARLHLPKMRGLLCAMFAELFRHMPLCDRVQGNSQAFNNIIGFCARNFNRELSLESLSEELHMSKYYISHLFSSRFNMKFNDYINSLRVTAACRYLCNSNKSVTEISELVGFGTPRTFNRAFLKQFGQSPSEYRTQNADLPDTFPSVPSKRKDP